MNLCSAQSQNLTQCISESIDLLKPFLETGDLGEGIKVFPLDPLALEDAKINPAPDFRTRMTNLMVKGFTKFTLPKLKIDLLNNVTIDAVVYHPRMEYYGNYDMDMKLSIIRLKGAGKVTGTLENTNCRVRMLGSKYIKDGQEFAKIDSCTVRTKVKTVKIQLDNLFNGDRVLGELGNRLINENVDLLKPDFIPTFERSFANVYKKITNDILALAPLNQLLPSQ